MATATMQMPIAVTAALKVDGPLRTAAHVKTIWKWLHSLASPVARYFQLPKSTPGTAITALCQTLQVATVPQGTLLARQGEAGSAFYVVVDGAIELLHHPVTTVTSIEMRLGDVGKPGAMLTDEDRRRLGARVAVVLPGMTFADVSACGPERDSSAVATEWASEGSNTNTTVLRLSSKAYQQCCPDMFSKADAMLRRRVGYLMALDLFSDWPAQELAFFARWMTEISAPDLGNTVYKQGSPADSVYFVAEGTVGLSCDHPTEDGEVLHLHHVVAPSFFGAREIMMDLDKRQHKAITASPDTTILVAPAPVFRALVTSVNATRAYQTASKLTANLEARNKWYGIRREQAGDSAEVPFSFLDHPQMKVLLPEVWASCYPTPDSARMADMFNPIQTNRAAITSNVVVTGAGGAGAGAGATTAATTLEFAPGDQGESLLAPNNGRFGRGASSASDARSIGFQRGNSSTSEAASRCSAIEFEIGTAPPKLTVEPTPVRRLMHQHTDMADLVATPKVNVDDDEDNLWSSYNTVTEDSTRRLELDAKRQDKVLRKSMAVELSMIMKAVTGFKRLLRKVRSKRAAADTAAAEPAHAAVSSARDATQAAIAEPAQPPAQLEPVPQPRRRRKSIARTGNEGAAVANAPSVGTGFRRNKGFAKRARRASLGGPLRNLQAQLARELGAFGSPEAPPTPRPNTLQPLDMPARIASRSPRSPVPSPDRPPQAARLSPVRPVSRGQGVAAPGAGRPPSPVLAARGYRRRRGSVSPATTLGPLPIDPRRFRRSASTEAPSSPSIVAQKRNVPIHMRARDLTKNAAAGLILAALDSTTTATDTRAPSDARGGCAVTFTVAAPPDSPLPSPTGTGSKRTLRPLAPAAAPASATAHMRRMFGAHRSASC